MSQKNILKYFCQNCDVYCSKPSIFNRHLLTAKHKKYQESDVLSQNKSPYDCSSCNYSTIYKRDWDKHVNTKKHKKNEMETNNNYNCDYCNKAYMNYKTFWSHKNKCKIQDKSKDTEFDTNMILNIDFVKKILQQNGELRNLLILQGEQMNEHKGLLTKQDEILNDLQTKQPMVVNNHNIMNNKFNLNVFLNEQCKDAMNLMDFVKNIQITNEDIENNGQLGFVGGISKIFLDNLKQLSVYERPIHCTDVKRETMYIKSDDRWQKEDNKTKLQKAITEISRKSVAKINQWKVETPEYDDMDSPEFMRGIIMSTNSMAGHNRESYADKIIRLLAKETMVDKNNLLL